MLLLAAAPARSAVTDAPFGQSPAQRIASLAAIPGGFQDTLSWDGHVARLFVNGRRAGQRAAAVRLGRLVRIRLGGDPRAGIWFWGRLDDVRVVLR